jgi:hypothetical protein
VKVLNNARKLVKKNKNKNPKMEFNPQFWEKKKKSQRGLS